MRIIPCQSNRQSPLSFRPILPFKRIPNINKLTNIAVSWCVFFQEVLLTKHKLDK
uniref:Uncharacterized protein n=1 Tax=Lepeophtheirus salmonis TaxID=72036 RepID=A0A0K2UM29_LEPSM